MKRIISIFIICLVVSFATVAFADVDFSTLSDEELLAAQKLLNEEIVNRGLIKKVKMPAGVYEVGVDIPVGKYVVTDIEPNNYNSYPQVIVYKNWYGFQSREKSYRMIYENIDFGGSCMVTLEQGNILYFVGHSFEVEKFNLSMFD